VAGYLDGELVMAAQTVTVVRIYLREGEHLLSKILKILHENGKAKGATVFQGIAGFGEDGVLRTASLVDLAMDLPLVVEFYGDPVHMDELIAELTMRVTLPHIVSWSAVNHA
jgi:PII-like signaling protein